MVAAGSDVGGLALVGTEKYPEGTEDQLVEALGPEFHPEYGPVLRAALFAIDRNRGTGK